MVYSQPSGINPKACQPPQKEEEQKGIIPALERSAKILEIDARELCRVPFKPKMVFKDKSFDSFLREVSCPVGMA